MRAEERERPVRSGVYANLTNDYMFKRVFGSEESKDILITFLNHIVGKGEISDVDFINTEHLGPSSDDRRAVFDIAVRTRSGDEYIIEMQLARQAYFRERLTYYMCYPIIRQAAMAKEKHIAEHGDSSSFRWNYNLKPVRIIGVMNFSMDHPDGVDVSKCHSSYRTREDTTGELLHDKTQYILLELGRFNKGEDELVDYYDKWLYLLKNMSQLQSRPKVFDETEFDRLFEMSELCNFTAEQYTSYENSQNMLYDYENTIDYARQQGIAEGREVGLAEGEARGREAGMRERDIEIAKVLKSRGMSETEICSITGLPEAIVLALQ